MNKPSSVHDLLLVNNRERNTYRLRHLNRLSLEASVANDTDAFAIYRLSSVENRLALGQVKSAKLIIDDFKSKIKELSPANQMLFYHFKGLFDSYRNHIIEALEAFDQSMTLSGTINPDLFHHTRLWKEITLYHFYEPEALNHLKTYLETNDYLSEYEQSMIAAHYVIGSLFLNKPISEKTWKLLSDSVNPEMTGPYILYLMAEAVAKPEKHQKEIINRLLLSTQGIKGDFWMINQYFYRYQPNDDSLQKWLISYLKPINNFVEQDASELFSHLPDEPKVSVTSCLNCDNRCCYDGVYVTYAEEAKIKAHIQKYPEEFTHVPTEFLEPGEWEFLFGGNRTKRVPHTYTREDYPKHFERTICVFALEDGSCTLQKSAIKHNYHPWALKPELCWKFPLIGLFNDNALEHPHYFGEKDPHYFDEEQPGYLSFLPCSKVTEDGLSWKKMYKNELQYFLAKKDAKKE